VHVNSPLLLKSNETGELLEEIQCPEIGELSYGHEEECDRYYLCINGTLTFEQCPNGLLHIGLHGAVYGHCGFPWNVNCGKKKIRKSFDKFFV
jgi:hypothetical protein